jgi:hypothetical protein
LPRLLPDEAANLPEIDRRTIALFSFLNGNRKIDWVHGVSHGDKVLREKGKIHISDYEMPSRNSRVVSGGLKRVGLKRTILRINLPGGTRGILVPIPSEENKLFVLILVA